MSKAKEAVELASKIDLHLTLSNSSPGFHLSSEELQMAAAALRFAATRNPKMTKDEFRSELASLLATMPYSVLLDVARDIHYMNAGDNAGMRDMTNAYGMAETLNGAPHGAGFACGLSGGYCIPRAGCGFETVARSSAESGDSKLPLQYEDGPDFCTVRDAQGRDFALTMQPDLMKAMEKALSDEAASFMRPPAELQPGMDPVAWITEAGLENWLQGDCPEKHVLLRTGGDMRRPLYTLPRKFTIADAWPVFKAWLDGYEEEERAFSRYQDNVILDGVMTARQRRAISAALLNEPQTSWQPIETAPKDAEATFLVCAVGDDRGPFVVRSDIMWQARKAGTPSHLGLSYLTHWMPLPEMPQ